VSGVVPRRWLAAAMLALTCAASAAASAQAPRYPAAPVDPDQELDDTSTLWERAIEPGRAPQERLLREARRALAARTPAELERAVAKATEAAALRPEDPLAYLVKATALVQLRRWRECAASYADALERDPKLSVEGDLVHGRNPLLGLGICEARAGRLALAEAALSRAVARSAAGAEEWLRLGETRIAMGKLREGLEALRSSAEVASDSSLDVINGWLRVLAYDRGRQTALADETARTTLASDPYLRLITYPETPLVHDTEHAYLLGVAWQAAGRPELALAYLRGLVAEHPDDMWRPRAAEHIQLLERTAFPTELGRVGPAPVDLAAAKAAVQRVMPQLVGCVAAVPMVAFDIKLTRSRPSTPSSGPRVVPPASTASITPAVVRGAPSSDALAAARGCAEKVLRKAELPPIRDPGTWYHLTFSLIAHPVAP
jgi:tetratricopeptide (TPR) repeat protein